MEGQHVPGIQSRTEGPNAETINGCKALNVFSLQILQISGQLHHGGTYVRKKDAACTRAVPC